MYMTAIIWYCYNYLNALNMARSIGLITIDGFSSSTNPMGPVRSNFQFFEIDLFFLLLSIRCIHHQNMKKRLDLKHNVRKTIFHHLIHHYFHHQRHKHLKMYKNLRRSENIFTHFYRFIYFFFSFKYIF